MGQFIYCDKFTIYLPCAIPIINTFFSVLVYFENFKTKIHFGIQSLTNTSISKVITTKDTSNFINFPLIYTFYFEVNYRVIWSCKYNIETFYPLPTSMVVNFIENYIKDTDIDNKSEMRKHFPAPSQASSFYTMYLLSRFFRF